MPQLLISTEPGIFVMADVVLDAGQDATDEDFIKIVQNGKFGAVRCEAFNMGYYRDGDQPPSPVSPVDDAEFDPEELIWIPIFASNSAADANFTPGQLDFPSLAPYTLGRLLIDPLEHYFDQAAGKVVNSIYAFDKGITNSQVYRWGVTLLFCIAQRLSIQFAAAGALAEGSSAAAGASGAGAGPGVGNELVFSGDLSGDSLAQAVIGIQDKLIDGGPTDGDALVYSAGSSKWEPTRLASADEVQKESLVYAADTGAANAYAVTLSPAPTIVAGSIVVFKAAHDNTGASTLAVNGGPAVAIKKSVSSALAAGDILAGQIVAVRFDGTSWQMPSGGGGGGSGTVTSAGLSTDADWLTIGASPITTSGVITLDKTDSLTANQVLATPDGSAGKVGRRSLVVADLPGDIRIRKVGVSIDGVGAPISTGVKGAPIQVDFQGTILGWEIIADQSGSITVEVDKHSSSAPPAAPSIPNTTTDKISAAAPISLSSAQSATADASGVSTWTTAVAKWDVIQFNVTAATNVQRVTLYLRIQEA